MASAPFLQGLYNCAPNACIGRITPLLLKFSSNRIGYNQFILKTNRSSPRVGSTFSKSGYIESYDDDDDDDEGREKILPKFMVDVRGMNLWPWRGSEATTKCGKKWNSKQFLVDTNNQHQDIWYTS